MPGRAGHQPRHCSVQVQRVIRNLRDPAETGFDIGFGPRGGAGAERVLGGRVAGVERVAVSAEPRVDVAEDPGPTIQDVDELGPIVLVDRGKSLGFGGCSRLFRFRGFGRSLRPGRHEQSDRHLTTRNRVEQPHVGRLDRGQPSHPLQPEPRHHLAESTTSPDRKRGRHLCFQFFILRRVARGLPKMDVDQPDRQAFRQLGLDLDASVRITGAVLCRPGDGRDQHAGQGSGRQEAHYSDGGHSHFRTSVKPQVCAEAGLEGVEPPVGSIVAASCAAERMMSAVCRKRRTLSMVSASMSASTDETL